MTSGGGPVGVPFDHVENLFRQGWGVRRDEQADAPGSQEPEPSGILFHPVVVEELGRHLDLRPVKLRVHPADPLNRTHRSDSHAVTVAAYRALSLSKGGLGASTSSDSHKQ